MKDVSDMRVIDHPSRDGFDLVQDIDVLQRRLINLEREFQEAIRAYRDARVNLVSADAGVKACKAEIDASGKLPGKLVKAAFEGTLDDE